VIGAAVDFEAAGQLVTHHLDVLYADWEQHPTVLGYGFDTGTAWAPLIDWDGVLGTFVYLVDKESGALDALGFNEFDDMPDPARVGDWPPDEETE
jgi:hypothetical protein